MSALYVPIEEVSYAISAPWHAAKRCLHTVFTRSDVDGFNQPEHSIEMH